MIGPALRMTDHYRFGWPNHRTRSLEEETHTLNFGNLIAVVNFAVFTRLLEVPPVVNRCAYDLAWVTDWGSELHFPNRDTRLIFTLEGAPSVLLRTRARGRLGHSDLRTEHGRLFCRLCERVGSMRLLVFLTTEHLGMFHPVYCFHLLQQRHAVPLFAVCRF